MNSLLLADLQLVLLMRHLIIFIFFLMFGNLYAQRTKPIAPHKLMGKGEVKIHGQFGSMLEFSLINKKPALTVDFSGHAIYNQFLYFGGYFNALISRLEKEIEYEILAGPGGSLSYTTSDLGSFEFYHYGIEAGYLWRSDQAWQATGSLKVGTGKMILVHPLDYKIYDNTVTVITPSVIGHYKINDWFKVSAAVGYRMVMGVENNDTYDVKSNTFNSPLLRIGIHAGYYNLVN